CRQVASTWNTRPRLALQPLHFLLRSHLAGRLAKPRTSFLPPKKWAATLLPLVRDRSDHRTAYSLRHEDVADGRIQEPHSTCSVCKHAAAIGRSVVAGPIAPMAY